MSAAVSGLPGAGCRDGRGGGGGLGGAGRSGRLRRGGRGNCGRGRRLGPVRRVASPSSSPRSAGRESHRHARSQYGHHAPVRNVPHRSAPHHMPGPARAHRAGRSRSLRSRPFYGQTAGRVPNDRGGSRQAVRRPQESASGATRPRGDRRIRGQGLVRPGRHRTTLHQACVCVRLIPEGAGSQGRPSLPNDGRRLQLAEQGDARPRASAAKRAADHRRPSPRRRPRSDRHFRPAPPLSGQPSQAGAAAARRAAGRTRSPVALARASVQERLNRDGSSAKGLGPPPGALRVRCVPRGRRTRPGSDLAATRECGPECSSRNAGRPPGMSGAASHC